jgi:hypothetical protein
MLSAFPQSSAEPKSAPGDKPFQLKYYRVLLVGMGSTLLLPGKAATNLKR